MTDFLDEPVGKGEDSSSKKLSRHIKLDTILSFGKYEGEEVEDICYDDPEYIIWLCEEEYVEADDEVLEIAERNT